MNLKLFKPDYKADKAKSNLDYTFFGEYVEKKGNKYIFKGGFGSNTGIHKNTRKLHHGLIDVLEHNFQINSLFKRFRGSLGSKYFNSHSKESNKHLPSLTSRKLQMQVLFCNDSSRINSKLSLCQSPTPIPLTKNLSFIQPNTNTSSTMPRLMSYDNLLNSREEQQSLSSIEQFPYLRKKINISKLSKEDSNKDKAGTLAEYKKIILKNKLIKRMKRTQYNKMDDYFIKSDKDYYRDRNYLFNKYKRKYDFYKGDKDDDFESKRLILFKKNSENYSLPKPSKHTINIIMLKNKK